MTRDEVIEMARRADIIRTQPRMDGWDVFPRPFSVDGLQRFAELVAAATHDKPKEKQ